MAPDELPEEEFGLRYLLIVLRRRKAVVILTVLATLALSLVFSLLQTATYEAKAEVLVQARSNQSLFENQGFVTQTDAQRDVQTQLRVFRSPPVTDAVRKTLGSAPSVSVSAVEQTDVIQVRATSTKPERARDIANAYADAYVEVRRTRTINEMLAAGEQIRAKSDELQKQIDDLAAQINNAGGAAQAPLREALNAQRDSLIGQQAVFKQKLDQLQVDSAIRTGGAELVTPAKLPSSPVSPRPVRNAVLGLFGGLILGVGLAFLADHLDDKINSKEDLTRAAKGVPVVGLIPALKGWKAGEDPVIVSVTDPQSPAAEAYRMLRTSIQFLSLDSRLGILQVTSPSAAEGKTTTLANLGVALASAGQKVAVVCCDLRRPRLHQFFGLDNTVGFTSVLLGRAPLSTALRAVPDRPGLSLLSSGPLPPNPSELLSSRRAEEVFTALEAEVDVVLVDSPPILPVTDALVLSSRADATLLVCRAGGTERKEVTRALELLSQVNAPLMGAVLNGVSYGGAYGYTYQYYTYRTDRSAATTTATDDETPTKKPSIIRPREQARK